MTFRTCLRRVTHPVPFVHAYELRGREVLSCRVKRIVWGIDLRGQRACAGDDEVRPLRCQRSSLPTALEQTKLTAAGNSLSAPFDLQLAEDDAVVSLHGGQRQEQPLTDLLVGEAFSHEVQDLELAPA